MDDRTWYLVGKMLSKEATDEELNELHRIQLSSPEASILIEELSKPWQATEEDCDTESEKAFQKHLERMEHEGLVLPSSLEEILKQKRRVNR